MKYLTKIIRGRGYEVKEFAKIIGKSYRTLKFQIDNGTMHYNDVKRVLKLLNIKFEDLEKIKPNVKPSKGEKKTEEEWSKLYIDKIKEPYAEQLLISILFESGKKVSLKEFKRNYNIKDL